MVTITSTKTTEGRKVKIFAYGKPGSRKTYAIATLPNPIILSAEDGLLSLREYDIPVIAVKSIEDVYAACALIEQGGYDSVAVDSISEIAALLLEKEEPLHKNGMAAYGEVLKKITKLVRKIRDLPLHVYVTAKAEKSQDQDGRISWAPSLTGTKLGPLLQHDFDEVFAARMEQEKDGSVWYGFMTSGNAEWTARDRSGVLDQWEPQDLGAIIEKILRGVK